MKLLAPGAIPLFALATAVLLRIEALPFAVGATAAGALVVAAAFAARRAPDRARGAAAATLLLAAVIALLGLAPGLWPCDVACRAGEEWATLFGVPTLAWAAGAALLTAALLALGRAPAASTALRLPGEVASRACAGASLFFVALAVQLSMPCRHCIAVHGALLAAAALVPLSAPSLRLVRPLALFGGALLTRQLFQWDLARTVSRPPPDDAPAVEQSSEQNIERPAETTDAPTAAPADATSPTAATEPPALPAALDDAALLASLERGRRFGAESPKLRAELVFSFNCGHCQESFEPLLDALAPLGERGLEVVVRLLHAKKDAASRELSKLAFAAGRDGHFRARCIATWAARVAALAGDGGGMQAAVSRVLARDAQNLAKLREVPDVAADAAFVAARPGPFEQLLSAEEKALQRLGGEGEMPWLFLVDPASGAVVEQLAAKTTPAQLAAAARRRLQ
ncbi:MAG: hypothetical protein JNL90_18900 [Planctomycetes bacterium]|nr:hypothetical protein [Planctomycetota bacterium]